MLKRPTYLWTLFFALQGTVFILCYLAQLEGIPDDLWLISLIHIPVVMVIAFLESALDMRKQAQEITSYGDLDSYNCHTN